MKKALCFIVGVLILGLSNSFAHAIWIETPATGTAGMAQQVNVYFGEFGTEQISKADEWFADLSQFELQLIHPDGHMTGLPVKASNDHYTVSFTPNAQGVYTLVIRKTAGEPYYGYKLDYIATAHVQVGDQRAFKAPVLPIHLQPANAQYRVDQAIDLSVLIDSSLSGDREITVISPNTWTKKLYPDGQSKASFVPLWPGKYLVEATVTDQNKGVWNGKNYDVLYSCHTYVLEVK